MTQNQRQNTTKGIYIIVLFAVNIELLHGLVTWELSTHPAVFGKDVKLTCSLSDDIDINRTRQWSKGKNLELVSHDGITTNISKYSEDYSSGDRTSTLTIMSMNENDVNIPYRCQHGFHTYKDILNMTVENFEYHPTDNQTNTHFEKDKTDFTMTVTFEKVFPSPHCTAMYGDMNLTGRLLVNSEPFGLFYRVEIDLRYHHISKTCVHHPLSLVCYIGTRRISQILEAAKNLCVEHDNPTSKYFPEKDQRVGSVFHAIFCLVSFIYVIVIPIVVYIAQKY